MTNLFRTHQLFLTLMFSASAYAFSEEKDNEEWQMYDDFLALGVVSVPEYEGSGDQQIVPLLFGQITFAGNRYLAIQGTGAQLNVLNSKEWAVGPSVNFGFGRDDGVDNEVIALLEEVDTAIELGGFISRTWQGVGHPSGSLSASFNFVQDVADAHDGWQAQANIGYGRSFGKKLRLQTNLGVTFVDDSFSDTYFSVTSMDSSASGLQTYEAEGGVKDYGVNAIATYRLSERWSAVGFVSYRRLVGDAVDSPIVDQEGDENQVILAFGFGYSF
ncbi:MAG: MipA/OmpV family protein [Pseudomonadota bacterium]